MKIMDKICCICGRDVANKYHRQIGKHLICDYGCDKKFSEWKESEDCLVEYIKLFKRGN